MLPLQILLMIYQLLISNVAYFTSPMDLDVLFYTKNIKEITVCLCVCVGAILSGKSFPLNVIKIFKNVSDRQHAKLYMVVSFSCPLC
jgi:hypothetical protein